MESEGQNIAEETHPHHHHHGPAQHLRERLLAGKGRLVILAAVIFIWVMDTVLSRHLVSSGAVGARGELLDILEWIGTAIMVGTTLFLLVALTRRYNHLLIPAVAIYLGYAVIQVIVNVISMLATAGNHQGGGLSSLWDVALVYSMSVIVFTFVYIYLDITTPGGAFIWPARDGQEPPPPNFLDYLFISMNVNSTYGPTSEAIMSRPGKMIMGLQVLLAVMMLTVLISRAVAATS
jgi:hypothetical protein